MTINFDDLLVTNDPILAGSFNTKWSAEDRTRWTIYRLGRAVSEKVFKYWKANQKLNQNRASLKFDDDYLGDTGLFLFREHSTRNGSPKSDAWTLGQYEFWKKRLVCQTPEDFISMTCASDKLLKAATREDIGAELLKVDTVTEWNTLMRVLTSIKSRADQGLERIVLDPVWKHIAPGSPARAAAEKNVLKLKSKTLKKSSPASRSRSFRI